MNNKRTVHYAYANNLGYLVCNNKEVIGYDTTTDNAEEFKTYQDAYDMINYLSYKPIGLNLKYYSYLLLIASLIHLAG